MSFQRGCCFKLLPALISSRRQHASVPFMLLPVVIDRCKHTHTHTHTRARLTKTASSAVASQLSLQAGRFQEGILVLRVTLGSLPLWDPDTVQPPNPPF